MKPKEFDELIRQKFDQNDFAYNPKNWDRLAEQLDGRAKKRSIIMWWLMPIAGIAASVALAMGIAPVLKQGVPVTNGINTEVAQGRKAVKAKDASKDASIVAQPIASTEIYYAKAAKSTKITQKHIAGKTTEEESDDDVQISLLNAVPNTYGSAKRKAKIDLLKKEETVAQKQDKKNPEVNEPVATFKPEAEQRVAKTSVIINGAYSHGSLSSGYAVGATIRRMVSDRVYIESDVAFEGSSNIQTNGSQAEGPALIRNNLGNAKLSAGAKTTGITAVDSKPTVGTGTNTTYQMIDLHGPVQSTDLSYDMYYAQVTPSVGCKLTRKFSVAAGPDIQRALADTRPSTDQSYTGTQLQAPLFDFGLMGKTEYALTRNVKAGVSYRKGMNNLFVSDKYTERDYLQFQVKCAIFNK